MATVNENIFSDSIKLVLRYDHKAESAFDKAHKEWIFSEFVKLLNNNERECHLTRKDDKEHRIIVPMPEEKYGGQLEIVAEWIPSKFSYEIKVNGKKKTKYNPQVTDIDKKYSIEESCEFVFLGEDDPFNDLEALRELKDLKERVDKLEIMTQAQIEDARKLWTKFIYAQQLRISKLQEPFECQGEPSLEPISNSKGETNKFKLTVPIKPLIPYNAFNELINEYNENFGGNISIETDTGISWMTKNEIEDVDKILHRTLGDSYERDSEITCILRIEPMDIRDQLYAELNMSTNRRYYVEYNKDDKMLHIWVNNENVPKIPHPIREKYNLTHSGVFCKFTKKDEFDKNYTETVRDIPEKKPSFSAIQNLADIMEAKAKAKKYEWEKEGDYKSVEYKIGCIYDYSYEEKEFNENFWDEVRRELYGLDYKISSEKNTVSFDFSDFNQLKSKIKTLTYLKIFKPRRNPLSKKDEGTFKFKVRFRAINGRKEILFNVREKLRNVAFVAEVANPGKKKNKSLYVGNLNGYESNDNQLVFNLPYNFPDEKKLAKDIISFLKNEEEDKDKQEANKKDEPAKKKNKEFIRVHADLRGDEVKLKWLREAIDKLSDENGSSSQPNSRPVNPRLRDFIFDSSKATPTYKFEIKEIPETEEYRNVRNRQLLELNESQLISVVKALNALDLCLLQGPPGTGKTTVIAELIWQHIMANSLTRILVTSETNLAVDNALEKLMNGKNVSAQLSRYLHIIKPLRFGRSSKFEEEGKRFSVERIERWLDEESSQDYEYENELSNLDDADNELQDDVEQSDPSYNAVQDWMCSIADRSQDGDTKYSKVLKEFKNELRNPSTITKRYFKDKYFKYANIIGSTCSSTGSPSFAFDYAKVYSSKRCDEYIKSKNYEITISDIKRLVSAGKDKQNDFAATARSIVGHILKENDIKRAEDFDDLLTNPTNDFKHFLFDYELKNLLREYSRNPEGDKTNKLMQTLDFETIEEFNQFLTISFDTVIMDEASKATPPDLVLPLCFGEKSIIIGDHRQLPPMLNDKEFKESIYELNDPQANELVEEIDREFTDTSQFSRLILNPSVSPTLKSVFTEQYRMHPQINDVISQFYMNDEGGLRCGLDLSKVDSEDLSEIESRHHGFYHDDFISKDVHTLWVNVDGPELRAESGALYNDSEVEAVKRVLTYLHNSEGFKEYMSYWDNNIKDEQKRNLEKEIGIISFYSRQVGKLREAKTLAKKLGMRVRLNTVDKFQGMERNIVIVSTVRSGKRMKNGNIVENRDSGFAKSPERLNVALSRARRLLIVVGDSEFFSNVRDRNKIPLYKNVIDGIQRHSEIIDYKSLTKYQAK